MNVVDAVNNIEEVLVVESLLKEHHGQIYADIWRAGLNLPCRITELLSMSYDNIDIKNKKAMDIINSRRKEYPGDYYVFQVKSNRTGRTIKPISRTSVSRAFKDIGERLGIKLNTTSMQKTREHIMLQDGIPKKDTRIRLKAHVAETLSGIQAGDCISFNNMFDVCDNIETLRHIIQWIIEDKDASIEFVAQEIIFDTVEKLDILTCIVDFQQHKRKYLQRLGINRAKAEGKFKGKKTRFTDTQIMEMKEKFHEPDANKTAIARSYGITRQHLYRVVERF